MGTKCDKCGMESDRDDICTWCNADIRRSKKPDAKGAAATPGQERAKTAPPAGAGATTPAPRRREMPAAARKQTPVWLPWVIGIGGALVLSVGGLYIYGLTLLGPVPDPGEWQTLTSVGKVVTLSYPKGWGEPENAGSEGSSVQITFRPNKLARMQLFGSGTKGSRGDTAAAAERMAGGSLPIAQSADGAVLTMDAEQFAKTRPDFKQGEIQEAYNCANRRSAAFEYTYTKLAGLVPVKMKGIRWGWFGGDLGFVCYAEAPEKHWDTFWKTAGQIAGGIKQGQ